MSEHTDELRSKLGQLKRELQECTYKIEAIEQEVYGTMSFRNAVKKIAEELHVSSQLIRKPTNAANIVLYRQITQYVLRHALNGTYPEIARATGRKDHTTIIHSCTKIERMREVNPEFDKKIRGLCSLFLDSPQMRANDARDIA